MLTVLNVAVLDLLQNLWPHVRVALLVLLLEFGLQLDNLREPSTLVLQPIGGGGDRGARDADRRGRVSR